MPVPAAKESTRPACFCAFHCGCPFIFRLDEYPDYLIAPMAQRCVRDVVTKGCPNVSVPNPVRFEMVEMARAFRYGAWTSRYILFACIKMRLKSYLKWQKRWYRELTTFMGEDELRAKCRDGYTPFCPGRV